MAFSFSPGQIAPQGSQAQAGGGGINPSSATPPAVGPPSDSPFLFIREKGQPFSIMACVQIVLVVATILSIVICGTLYAYSLYLKDQISTKKEELIAKDALLPDYQYADMLRLSKRTATLDRLLQNYISARSPLKFLENVVENQVYFDKFTLSRDPMGGSYTVTFTAVTTNYTTLIQQLEALNLTEYSKVAPKVRLGELSDGSLIKINVTTPVFVLGKLPDEVVFFAVDEKQKTAPSSAASTSTLKSSVPATSLSSTGSTTTP